MFRYGAIALLVGLIPALPLVDAEESRSAGDPVQVMNAFYTALQVGDFEKAESFVLRPTEGRRQEKLKQSVQATSGAMRNGKLKMKALESRVQGSWAVVVGRIEMRQKAKWTSRIRDEFMFRQDGQWKVVPEAVRSDPAVKPHIDEDFEALFKWYRANQDDLRKKHLEG